MKEQLHLKNHLKEVRMAANLSQAQLAEMVGVSNAMCRLIRSVSGVDLSSNRQVVRQLCSLCSPPFTETVAQHGIKIKRKIFQRNKDMLDNIEKICYGIEKK